MQKTSKQFDSNKPTRQAQLKAWLALNEVRHADLARELQVHPSMITRIIKGDRAPAKRIEQLAALGIPKELLPLPSNPPGRPPRVRGVKNTQTDTDG